MKKLFLFLVALTMILTSCKPEAEKPTVVTKSIGEVTETSAKVVGQVTSDGGAEVTERGVCWNTEGAPEVIDFRTKDGSGVGSFTSNISDLVPNTQYYVRAYATNEVGTVYGEEIIFKTLEAYSPATGFSNGYGYVDLGLSVKWATCNVGASTPEEYGDYFAWGETNIKETYTEDNSLTNNLSYSQLQLQGYIDGEDNLTSQYDAATINCGGDWRMPTSTEQVELENKCIWTWTVQNGVNGYKVTGPNGNSIFLPAAGYRLDSSLIFAGSEGLYLSSTGDTNNRHAYGLDFDSDCPRSRFGLLRFFGQSVRPVIE